MEQYGLELWNEELHIWIDTDIACTSIRDIVDAQWKIAVRRKLTSTTQTRIIKYDSHRSH